MFSSQLSELAAKPCALRSQHASQRRQVEGHLARAEQLARQRVSGRLSPLQQLVRSLLLNELARYRERGRFPRNVALRQPTPHFVDDRGVRCAVAHLLELGGEGALVERISRERNHARVRALSDEPRLLSWLSAAGLTLEEAAAIQPAYPVCEAAGACVCGDDTSSVGLVPVAADGILHGTVIEVETADRPARMRVHAVYGDADSYANASEVTVQASEGPDSLEATGLKVGDQLVVPVWTWSDTVLLEDGGLRPLEAIKLASDETYSCRTEGALATSIGPLSRGQLDAVLTASNCPKALGAIDESWGAVHCTDDGGIGCGCSLAKSASSTAAPSTLGVLLFLTAAMLAARRLSR